MLVLVAGALAHVLLLGLSDPNSWQVFFVYSNMIKYKIVALLHVPSVMFNAVALVIGPFVYYPARDKGSYLTTAFVTLPQKCIPTTPGLRAQTPPNKLAAIPVERAQIPVSKLASSFSQ